MGWGIFRGGAAFHTFSDESPDKNFDGIMKFEEKRQMKGVTKEQRPYKLGYLATTCIPFDEDIKIFLLVSSKKKSIFLLYNSII